MTLDPTKWQQINNYTWVSTRDEPREIPRPDAMIRAALEKAQLVTEKSNVAK